MLKMNDIYPRSSKQTMELVTKYGLSEALKGRGMVNRFVLHDGTRIIVMEYRTQYYVVLYDEFNELASKHLNTMNDAKARKRIESEFRANAITFSEVIPGAIVVGKRVLMEFIRRHCQLVEREEAMSNMLTIDHLAKLLRNLEKRIEAVESYIENL